MTKIERIEYMLREEQAVPERDEAGVINPRGVDSAVKCRQIQDCLSILKSEDVDEVKNQHLT